MKPVNIAYVEGWLAFLRGDNIDDNPKKFGQSWDWSNGYFDAEEGVELGKIEPK